MTTQRSAFQARAQVLAATARRKLRLHTYSPLPALTPSAPGKTIPCAPALFDPDTLDRVKACGFKSTMDFEINRLTATQFTESPVEHYRLGPAIVAGGQIFTNDAIHLFSEYEPLKALRSKMERLGKGHLANSSQGMKYFGHWLRDDCCVYELLLEQGHTPLSLTRQDWPDARAYEQAFGHKWRPLLFAEFDDLHVYRDIGFNLDKARRIRALRAKLRKSYTPNRAGEIVYISRGKTGSARTMSNADAFEARLAAEGIKILVPGTNPDAMIADMLDARIIVTIEGSQSAHGVFTLRDGGGMINLQPPDRFYNPHRDWTRLMDMYYGMVIGTSHNDSFLIDADEVLRMVDKMDGMISK